MSEKIVQLNIVVTTAETWHILLSTFQFGSNICGRDLSAAELGRRV